MSTFFQNHHVKVEEENIKINQKIIKSTQQAIELRSDN